MMQPSSRAQISPASLLTQFGNFSRDVQSVLSPSRRLNPEDPFGYFLSCNFHRDISSNLHEKNIRLPSSTDSEKIDQQESKKNLDVISVTGLLARKNENTNLTKSLSLQLNDIHEVIQLQEVILTCKLPFFSQIQELWFAFELTNASTISINQLLNTISHDFFPSLSRLIFQQSHKIRINDLSDPSLNPISFDKLFHNTSLSWLKELIIQIIDNNFILPSSFKNLDTLVVETISNRATLTLLESTQKLTKLYLGNLSGKLAFPSSLNSLTSLYIDNIPKDAELHLSTSLKNLEFLSIKSIYGKIHFSSSLDSLTSLYIDKIGTYGELQFPTSFKNLASLFIKSIHGKIHFPSSLDSLTALSIDDIAHSSMLQFPISLKNLASLSIKSIRGKINFSSSMYSLTSLSIVNIPLGSTLELPISLKNLLSLSLSEIGGTLSLPSRLATLRLLDIKNVYSSAQFQLPIFSCDLSTLSIEGIFNTICFRSPLDGLISLSIKDIFGTVIFPLNLFIFSSYSSVQEEPVKVLHNLTTLSINKVYRTGNLILPESLNSLKKIDFQEIGNPELHKQLLFIQKNMKPHDVNISPSESFANPSTETIPTLRIDSIEQFLKSYDKYNTAHFFDVKQIKINDNSSSQLNELFKFFELYFMPFHYLEKLTFQVIEPDTQINLSDSFSKIKSLCIEEIEDNVVINCPESLCNIETLAIGTIWNFSQLKFSDLNLLTTCSFGDIKEYVTIEFPQSLPVLQSFSIKDISIHANLKLPNSIPLLTELVLGDAPPSVILAFSEACPNLTTLTLGNIYSDMILTFPNGLFPMIKNLTIGNFGSNIILTFPESFSNLNSLTIGDVGSNVTFNLPNTFFPITIGHFGSNVIFVTTNIFPQPTILSTTALPINLKLIRLANGHNSYRVEH